MGRASFEPTDDHRRQVSEMAGLGIRQEHIATILGISPPTLRKYFRHELDHGAIQANTGVLKTLFQMATSGKNTWATVFWAKTRCGFRENAKPSEGQDEIPELVILAER